VPAITINRAGDHHRHDGGRLMKNFDIGSTRPLAGTYGLVETFAAGMHLSGVPSTTSMTCPGWQSAIGRTQSESNARGTSSVDRLARPRCCRVLTTREPDTCLAAR